ncbi:MAG: flavodoxin family protein [Clostridiaceae bacterium]|nr:flavodoxin family protein [Clostridiaceae bacterium]
MKVVAFNGSPRVKGNTYILLNTVLKTLEKEGIETELVHVGKRDIHGCTACQKCRELKNGRCVFNDDIVNRSIEKIEHADGVILGAPVYFGDMCSQMKAFIDRVGYATRSVKTLKGKVCASVVAVRRNGALYTFNAMNNLFTLSESIIVGSSYWNQGIGNAVGAVENDEEGLDTMVTLGKNMAEVLKSLKRA